MTVLWDDDFYSPILKTVNRDSGVKQHAWELQLVSGEWGWNPEFLASRPTSLTSAASLSC